MEKTGNARTFRFAPVCASCGGEGSTLEVIAPGGLPERWADWTEPERRIFNEGTDSSVWRVIYAGIAGGNGLCGDLLLPEEVTALRALLEPRFRFQKLKRTYWDGLGWCLQCRKFYCHKCWQVAVSGQARCPRGHDEDFESPW